MTSNLLISADRYRDVYEAERCNLYPAIDVLESECGYALGRERLEDAARVLACPVKAHPPNWQHGRTIYAVVRRYLESCSLTPVIFLDIGTAKGFSALCFAWAARDAERSHLTFSLDVIDPSSHALRNSCVESDGPKTLAEITEPWHADLMDTLFLHGTGVDWLKKCDSRISVAFVDGKHRYDVVSKEADLLAGHQESGDVILFDDVQIEGVADAVADLAGYTVTYLQPKPERRYAIARRE